MEGCPSCRKVRAELTELDLDFVHKSCGKGELRNRQQVQQRGGAERFPYLVDPNRGVELYESSAIIAYLNEHYGWSE